MIPCSVHGHLFVVSLSCAVKVLKSVVIHDVAHGVSNSGRWEIRQCGGWGGWGGLGWGSELGVLHSASEAVFVYEDG